VSISPQDDVQMSLETPVRLTRVHWTPTAVWPTKTTTNC